jgi:hypothetical protein
MSYPPKHRARNRVTLRGVLSSTIARFTLAAVAFAVLAGVVLALAAAGQPLAEFVVEQPLVIVAFAIAAAFSFVLILTLRHFASGSRRRGL